MSQGNTPATRVGRARKASIARKIILKMSNIGAFGTTSGHVSECKRAGDVMPSDNWRGVVWAHVPGGIFSGIHSLAFKEIRRCRVWRKRRGWRRLAHRRVCGWLGRLKKNPRNSGQLGLMVGKGMMDVATATDSELVMAIQRDGAGDVAEELMRRHLPRVRGMMYQMALNHADADDLTQEVFIRAWRGLAGFRSGACCWPETAARFLR